jgi:thiol-disulfide isomerase/thioredoxin
MIEDDRLRRSLLVFAVLVVATTIQAIEASAPQKVVPAPPEDLPASEEGLQGAADFSGATGWLNTPGNRSLDLVALRGKVVLVDFWTYSCINCIHTLPHLTRLYDTYAPYGFVLVGAHTPEFAFEKDRGNVAAAIARHGIHYPVAQDNRYGIWDAYGNHYWPAHYLVDQYGKVRATHFGEGGYAETERQVRGLLAEAGAASLPAPIEDGVEDYGDHTGELYATSGRSGVGNPEGYREGSTVDYRFPDAQQDGHIYLDGRWLDSHDSVDAMEAARVRVPFHGAAANVVAGGPDGACVEVLLDGAPLPADLAAPDVRAEAGLTCLVLGGDRSYDLYEGPREAHVLELKVPEGFRLFTFDFT